MPFKKPHHTAESSFVTKVGGRYEIKPRGLNIVWGNDSRYWKIPDQGNAELIQVSWLEVSGVANDVERNKKYTVTFHVKIKEDGFGWNGTEVLVMAKVGKKGKYDYKVATLTPGASLSIPIEKLEITVPQDATDRDLYFGLYEVWSGKWKGGLEIISAEVVPIN
ncbi:protein PHLOEM PROTEIN 2-LIKE A9-like [Gastrolobium bilobum]|uniref:protein PHLOEM PROTEIN 2-LIKE A9-like n=1 Tax=Gastrolobium bilobum TaxID=150636 RepID=UPI002AB1B507|nr:protein PHLOEM PROTEIN 2-LIKE A9-like [Gastrolobium bilobum]